MIINDIYDISIYLNDIKYILICYKMRIYSITYLVRVLLFIK